MVEVAKGDPWQAAVISANLGGYSGSTIGAIAASMAGCAWTGNPSLPEEHVAGLKGIDLAEVRARWPPTLSRRALADQAEKEAA